MKRDIVEKEPLKRVIYEEIKENEIENRDFKDLIAKFYLDDINFDDTDDGEHWRFESEADQFFIVLYSNPNYNWPTKKIRYKLPNLINKILEIRYYQGVEDSKKKMEHTL